MVFGWCCEGERKPSIQLSPELKGADTLEHRLKTQPVMSGETEGAFVLPKTGERTGAHTRGGRDSLKKEQKSQPVPTRGEAENTNAPSGQLRKPYREGLKNQQAPAIRFIGRWGLVWFGAVG